jgi:hypothetical protein
MTYHGKVKNGVIILEAGAELRDGTRVKVEPVVETEPSDASDLQRGLLGFSGVVKDGPTDLARNHDHYLHGNPKK